jgi:hypothetical protein
LVEVHSETRRARHRTPVAGERPVDVHQPVVERQPYVDHCASLDSSAGAVTAFVVAFAGSVALWWI